VNGPPPEHFPAPWAGDWGEDRFGLWQSLVFRGVRQAFRWLPPGRFLMGSPATEHAREDDEQQHEVELTRGLWLADTACTQALWQAVTGNNPSGFKGEKRPVEMVSWDDVQTFLAELNRRVLGMNARLPTEAEWEYGCRAGTPTPFSFGEDIIPEQVNYDGNYPYRGSRKGLYRGETVEVASLPANPWGLYEMHGNVWEWCADWYGEYPPGTAVDPAGPETGGRRVLRGGSWISFGRYLRSACRYRLDPGDRYGIIGFRLALGPELEPAEPRAGSGAGQAARAETGGNGRRGRSGAAGRPRKP